MTDRRLKVIAGLGELDRTSLRERAMDRLRHAVATPGDRAGNPAGGDRTVGRAGHLPGHPAGGAAPAGTRGPDRADDAEPVDRAHGQFDGELTDMFTVRSALEGLAAAVLSTRADRRTMIRQLHGAVGRLQAADDSIGELDGGRPGLPRAAVRTLTGNTTLLRAWETLTGPMRMAILFAGPAAALVNMSAARHQDLVDAIATGDPHTARSRSPRTCGRPPGRCSTRTRESAPRRSAAGPPQQTPHHAGTS